MHLKVQIAMKVIFGKEMNIRLSSTWIILGFSISMIFKNNNSIVYLLWLYNLRVLAEMREVTMSDIADAMRQYSQRVNKGAK